MSPSAWLAGARALLRRTRGGNQVPTRPQQREHAASTGNEAAPAPTRSTAFVVEHEIRSVLGEVAAAAEPQPVRFEIAVQPDLMLYGDRAAFRHALVALVRQASARAMVGRVLVTASRSGEWLQVSVTDDGIGADRKARQDALRAIEDLIAREGGMLEIESWPDQGSALLMRWPHSRPAKIGQDRVPSAAQERVWTG